VYVRDSAATLRRLLAENPKIELVDRIDQADAVLSLPPVRRADETPVEALTTRELDVLELVADGRSNHDIGTALEISDHTVKFHLASIYGKLGVSTRTEAVQRGLRLGVIEI